MLYKQLIINGEVFQIAVNQTGQGKPSEKTVGAVGVLYMDTNTGDFYKCTSEKNGTYIWENFSVGSNENGNSGQNQEAVLYIPQTLTEDQKAQARANIGAIAGDEVQYADTVEWLNEHGDTSKKYVLPDGYIYEYTEKYVTEKHNANNENRMINQKPNVNAVDGTISAESGVLVSDAIPFSADWLASGETARAKSRVAISGIDKLVPTYNSSLIVYLYKEDGTYITAWRSSTINSLGNPANTDEIELPVSFYIKDSAASGISSWSDVGYVRILLGISTDGDITEDDIANVVINCPYYDFEGTKAGWYSTGQQHSNDKATQQNSADIAELKDRTEALEADVSDVRDSFEKNGLTRVHTGEVLYAVGDSITYGSGVGGNNGSWVKHVIDINGYDTINSKNLGISGIGFCTEASSKTVRNVVDENDFSAADIVTVAIGVNDWKNYNATLTDFFSEMEYCLTKIRGDNPYCKIFYILPFNYKPSGSNFDTFYALGYIGDSNQERPYGNSLQTFINMMKSKFEEDTLKALDIHVIDMTKTPAITRYNIDTALSDGLHPTADCHKELAKDIARRISLA